MAKLKGVKRINRILNDFIHAEIDEELNITLGSDFAYYYANNEITYSLVISEKNEIAFRQFFKFNGYKFDDNIFILSLFHAIGHYMVGDELSEEDIEFSQHVKTWLDTKEDKTKEMLILYFSLPDELAATRWAIDYLNNLKNNDKINKFWNELQPAIMRFYRKNRVLSDNSNNPWQE